MEADDGGGALFRLSLAVLYLSIPFTILPLLFLTAPYGRHLRPGWGPLLPAPLAWFLMESPTLLLPFAVLLCSHRRDPLLLLHPHPLVLLPAALFLIHYTHRVLIFPLRLSRLRRPPSPMPFSVAAMGFAFNVLNAYAQTHSLLLQCKQHSPPGLLRAAVGAAVFALGMRTNVAADRQLLRLREESGGAYRVPEGGWFDVVCCPNYMGEAAEWLGYAVAAWSPAAWGFFLYTCANLGPRARAHRRWYLEKFKGEWPASRKAMIPYVF